MDFLQLHVDPIRRVSPSEALSFPIFDTIGGDNSAAAESATLSDLTCRDVTRLLLQLREEANEHGQGGVLQVFALYVYVTVCSLFVCF